MFFANIEYGVDELRHGIKPLRPPIPIITLALSYSSLSPHFLCHSLRLPVLALPFASRIVRNSYASLRSSIHSSSGNPSPSRQNGSRPRGAPHRPHIRNTLEIVLSQPPMPTSFRDHAGYGGVSSVNRRDSRDSARSADSWTGAAISRTSSEACLTMSICLRTTAVELMVVTAEKMAALAAGQCAASRQ
ncbi:hypothetical protein BS47DRAFT_1393096 [Hydnum rufescens UP504]|uniref:Uncharacterized protein n=1 Tax=Hydnum rufescens UP504 TaxID=1448309 RepID=A0A9P6DXB1_9AGAM|nr:hypothetical protein BS47DRAFT_1393096 [Hydnum rufescens UP504]